MPDRRPNLLFIMSDDHAAHAISAYGSRLNRTPHIDRLAEGGLRLDNCFCTNSICAPSRSVILTGLYSHMPGNGVLTLLERFDGSNRTVQAMLREAGYQTGIFGKWHLGHGGVHDPTGFDCWHVLPGQGEYHDPRMFDNGREVRHTGYATDLITDFTIDWLQQRDRDRPFLCFCHHKAPHRPWEPDDRHATMYEDLDIPEPETFDDDYTDRAAAAAAAKMRMEHLDDRDTKCPRPADLTGRALRSWLYQRYIKDYLRCVASIDDNVGRLLDYLDADGLTDDTVVIYTSDQGFFLGDHGWYDKRFMYEESLRMPFLVRYPREIPAGSTSEAMALNVDFAQTFLDYAGVPDPGDMQGASLRSVFAGNTPDDWRRSMYYRYFMHCDGSHNVYAHYGLRTHRHKLIYYYEDQPEPPEWELFDLERDPCELHSVYHDPAYAGVRDELRAELKRLRHELGDETKPWPE